jgi:hypothetical protein
MPDDIIETVEVIMKQLTSAILREPTFLAQGEQEHDIVSNPNSLSQKFNDEFVSVASHLDKGRLSFPRIPCQWWKLCGGIAQ